MSFLFKNMIDTIINLITSFVISGISTFGYLGIIIMMAIESACIPLPSELILSFSGFLVISGRFSLWGITLAGSFGTVIGSAVAYAIGRYGGRTFIEKYGKYILISRHDLAVMDGFFNKFGQTAVFFSRMMPVVRTYFSLPAGIAKMNFIKFTIYSFLGSLPWCYGFAWAGKKLGDHWETLGVYFRDFYLLFLAVIMAGLVWYVWRHVKNVKRESEES